MKQAKASLSLLLFAVLSVTVLAVAPVSARRVNAESQTTTQSDGTETETQSTGDTETADQPSEQDGLNKDTHRGTVSHKNDKEARQEQVEALRERAHQELAQKRDGKPETSAQQRQKLCENRQKAVNNKISAFSGAADRHLAKLNDVFTKLQDYQKQNNVAADNYDQLLKAATLQQQAATQNVAALKVVTVNIDCTSTDPASSLMAVKDAATEARNSLQSYRMSLKDIVTALAKAADNGASTSTTTTEGDN